MKPILENITTHRLFWLINLFLVSLLVALHVRLGQYAFDDAYIHFRIARNFFESGAPYFNDNNILKVSTSSGWTVFLILLYGLIRVVGLQDYFPLWVGITNALVVMSGSYMYIYILEILFKKITYGQKLIFQVIYIALLLHSSTGLMESPLTLLAAGAGLYLILRSNPFGFALLGLAVYLRLEIFFLFGLVFILTIIQKQFEIKNMIGYSLMGILPLIFFDLYYFQTVIPHSIVAKMVIYPLSYLDVFLKILVLSLFAAPNENAQVLLVKALLFAAINLLTGWIALKRALLFRDLWAALFYFSGLGIIIFYIIGRALLVEWYIPLYVLPIFVSLYIAAYMTKHWQGIILKVLLFFMAFISVIFIVKSLYSAFFTPNTYFLFEGGSRVKTYLAVGKILDEEYPGTRLLTSEIGGLGYSFHGEILDAAGLASSEVLRFYSEETPEFGGVPLEYVRQKKPELIVTYDVFGEALAKHDIINEYNAIVLPAYLPEDAIYSKNKTIWGSQYLRIYIHKSLPVTDNICALAAPSEAAINSVCNP